MAWGRILRNKERTAVYLKTVVANPEYEYKTAGLLTINITTIITVVMLAAGMGVCVPRRVVLIQSDLKPLASLSDTHHTQPVSCKQNYLLRQM